MRINREGRSFLISLLLASVLTAMAQGQQQVGYAAMASSKFTTLPVLPACMTFAAQRGGPTKGASVLLLKFKSGCVVPWHWHTANENLMMVSGRGKAEMKSGGVHSMTAGDYLYMPAKQGHQFTCLSSCVLFDATDGAFDIHYIGSDGAEITPEQALKGMAQPAMKKTPAAKPQ